MTTQPALLLDLTQRDTKTISLKQIFALQNAAYGSLADVRRCFSDVRFVPNSGHSADELKCPLSANRRHRDDTAVQSVAIIWDCSPVIPGIALVGGFGSGTSSLQSNPVDSKAASTVP